MRDGTPMLEALERERTLLEPIRNRANVILDTSKLSTECRAECLLIWSRAACANAQ